MNLPSILRSFGGTRRYTQLNFFLKDREMERRQGNKTHTRPREREREYENTTHPPLHSALGHSHEPRGCTAPHSLFLHIPVTTPLQTSYLLCASQSSFSLLFTPSERHFVSSYFVCRSFFPSSFFSLWGREKISRITRKCVRTLSLPITPSSLASSHR